MEAVFIALPENGLLEGLKSEYLFYSRMNMVLNIVSHCTE